MGTSWFTRSLSAALVAGFCFAGTVSAGMTDGFKNGDMEDATILSSGDTIPTQWSTNPSPQDGLQMRWDPVEKHSGNGSMNLIATVGSASKVWVGGPDESWITAHAGNNITIAGYVKADGVADNFRIAVVTFCGGGGYCQLGYQQALNIAGSTLGWQKWEYTFDLPSEATCQASACGAKGILGPEYTLHMHLKGPGKIWLDSIYAVDNDAGGSSVFTDMPVASSVSPVRFDNGTVSFETAASYKVSVISTDGRVVFTDRGFGTEVALRSQNLARGTYVVKVNSSLGNGTHNFVVQ